MGILGWTKRLFASSDPPFPFDRGMGERGWHAATHAGPGVSETSCLTIPAFYRAIDNLISHISMLPAAVVERVDNTRTQRPEHPVYSLLNIEANPEMTAFDALRAVWMARFLSGNGRFEIERRNNGEPIALWPMPAGARLRRIPYRTGDIYHEYYDDGGEVRIPDRDVLHLKGITSDGISAMGLVHQIARENLGIAIAIQEYAASFFGNQAIVGTVFVGPPGMTKEQKKANEDAIRAAHEGSSKAWRSMVLTGGAWDVKKAGADNRNAQMIETMTVSLQDAARWLNMPPPLLMDYSRSTFSNIREIDQWYVKYSLAPHFRQFEQEANRKLFRTSERVRVQVKINPDALLRGDPETRAEMYTKGISCGRYSINRILELEDENDIGPAGDVHYVPTNLTTAERMQEGEVGGSGGDDGTPDDDDMPDGVPPGARPTDDEPDDGEEADERHREAVVRAFSHSFAGEGEHLALRWEKQAARGPVNDKFVAETAAIVSRRLTSHIIGAMELLHGIPLPEAKTKLARDIAEFSLRAPMMLLRSGGITPREAPAMVAREVGTRLGVE